MEQRVWAYVVGGTDGRFCVGAHRGDDLESHVEGAHGPKGGRAILWAETFRDDKSAIDFAKRFRRWPYRRQAQLVIADQLAA